jgi:hypothetical protein
MTIRLILVGYPSKQPWVWREKPKFTEFKFCFPLIFKNDSGEGIGDTIIHPEYAALKKKQTLQSHSF